MILIVLEDDASIVLTMAKFWWILTLREIRNTEIAHIVTTEVVRNAMVPAELIADIALMVIAHPATVLVTSKKSDFKQK